MLNKVLAGFLMSLLVMPVAAFAGTEGGSKAKSSAKSGSAFLAEALMGGNVSVKATVLSQKEMQKTQAAARFSKNLKTPRADAQATGKGRGNSNSNAGGNGNSNAGGNDNSNAGGNDKSNAGGKGK